MRVLALRLVRGRAEGPLVVPQLRDPLAEMIGFLGRLQMPPWAGDAEAAHLLAGALANDHV
jgi:hypothetical protein